MARRFNDTNKWKNQRWFRKLPAYYKLAWEYIIAQCDIAGVWSINCPDLQDDLVLPDPINLEEFVRYCNRDWHEVSGEQLEKERLIIINEKFLWITPFMVDQYLGKKDLINPDDPMTRSAMKKLANYGKLAQAIRKGWLPLTHPYEGVLKGLTTPLEGVKEKEKEREREINTEIVQLFFPEDLRKGKKREPAAGEDPEGGSGKPALGAIRGGKKGDALAPPDELPIMTAQEFLDYEARMLADHLFIDPLMASKGNLTPDILKKWIVEFHVHIAGDERLRKDYKAYKSHFKNWLNLVWPKGLPEIQASGRKAPPVAQVDKTYVQDKYGKP